MKRSHMILSVLPLAWIVFTLLTQLQFYSRITSDSTKPPESGRIGDHSAGPEQPFGLSSPAAGMPFHYISFCPEPIPLTGDSPETIFTRLPLPSHLVQLLYPRPFHFKGMDARLYSPRALTRRFAGIDSLGVESELIGCLNFRFYTFPWDSVTYRWHTDIHVLKWSEPISLSRSSAFERLAAVTVYDSMRTGRAAFLKYRTTRLKPDTSFSYTCLWGEGPWLTRVTATSVPPKDREAAENLFDSLIERISLYYRDLNRRYVKEGS